jgi:hypothetical protein
MADLSSIIIDHFPPVDGVAIPLLSSVTITFDRLMNEERLVEDFVLEGPDTDQFVGPGLIELRHPGNISQGDLDDFLRSPGYQGVVRGEMTFETIDGNKTKLIFTPSMPLAAKTDYVAHLLETLDANDVLYEGHVIWPFQTGTGSIEELPSNISTSVLTAAHLQPPSSLAGTVGGLTVTNVSPLDHSVEQDIDLEEIVVTFNKNLDPASISDDIVTVETIPATDHPGASTTSLGELVKQLEVVDNQLKIKL